MSVQAEELSDPDLQKALVANSASFTASAQSRLNIYIYFLATQAWCASVVELSSNVYSEAA